MLHYPQLPADGGRDQIEVLSEIESTGTGTEAELVVMVISLFTVNTLILSVIFGSLQNPHHEHSIVAPSGSHPKKSIQPQIASFEKKTQVIDKLPLY